MNTQPTGTPTTAGATLADFEKRIRTQIERAEGLVAKFEAAAKEKRLQAEATTLSAIKTARVNLEQKLKDLAASDTGHVARAKKDIDTAATALKNALDTFEQRLSTLAGKN